MALKIVNPTTVVLHLDMVVHKKIFFIFACTKANTQLYFKLFINCKCLHVLFFLSHSMYHVNRENFEFVASVSLTKPFC